MTVTSPLTWWVCTGCSFIPGPHALDETLSLALAELLKGVLQVNADAFAHVGAIPHLSCLDGVHDALLRCSQAFPRPTWENSHTPVIGCIIIFTFKQWNYKTALIIVTDVSVVTSLIQTFNGGNCPQLLTMMHEKEKWWWDRTHYSLHVRSMRPNLCSYTQSSRQGTGINSAVFLILATHTPIHFKKIKIGGVSLYSEYKILFTHNYTLAYGAKTKFSFLPRLKCTSMACLYRRTDEQWNHRLKSRLRNTGIQVKI